MKKIQNNQNCFHKNNFENFLDSKNKNTVHSMVFALVAQLDRVPGFEPVGWGFKSLPGRQTYFVSSYSQHYEVFFIK